MLIGKGLGCWKTMPTWMRREQASMSKTSVPSSSTRPSWRTLGTKSHMRLNVRSSVDLPQPDGPMKAVQRFLGMERSMPLRAWKSPYQRLRPRTSMRLSAASRAHLAYSASAGVCEV